MALPLPRVVADVGPGGGIVSSMNAINALANMMHLKEYNKIKSQLAPTTLGAEAASKLAYANLMGPQFLAKMLGNEGIIANMGDPAARAALQKAVQAGMGTNGNMLNQMPTSNTGIGQPSTNSISGWVTNKLKNAFNKPIPQSPNPFAHPFTGYDNSINPGVSAEGPGAINNGSPFVGREGYKKTPPQQMNDGIDHELDAAYMDWLKSPEGQAEINKVGGSKIPSPEELKARFRMKQGKPSIELELNEGQKQPSWAENVGKFKGVVKEGEELGKHRGQVISDIGEQQLALSTSGANLDRIIEDINAPEFMELRKDFPFYQDMQLTALSKIGNPEQQEMIGNFIADVKSFAGATVNQFKGATMKREFDYADQLKPSENDTVNTARGKLTALKSLKEIAQRKNDIILDLMQNKHMNIGDAVKIANKIVDVKAIGEEVKKLNSPMISLKNPKTGITIRLPLWEARKRGVKNV